MFRIAMRLVASLFLLIVASTTTLANTSNVDLDGAERTVKLYLYSVEKGLWESAFNSYLYPELRDKLMPYIPTLKEMEKEMGPRRFENINVYWTEIARTEDGIYLAESHVLYKLVPVNKPSEAQEVGMVFRLVNFNNNVGWKIVAVSELPVEIAHSEMIVLARLEVQAIGAAIEVFRVMEGRYPTVREMEVQGKDNILVRTGYLTNYGVDPWGNNYIYIPPEPSRNLPGMVWSTAGDINDRSSPGNPSQKVKQHNLYYILEPFKG